MTKGKLLVIVDMQNDFIDGALKNLDAQAIVPKIVKKIKEFDGDAIMLTMDTHNKEYLETAEGRHLPIVHCVMSTDGWEINKKIHEAVQKKGIRYTMEKKGTFGDPYIGVKAYECCGTEPGEIEICGTCTDICVVSNALTLKTAYPDADIKVLKDLCAGVTKESHEAALLTMKMCQIEIV